MKLSFQTEKFWVSKVNKVQEICIKGFIGMHELLFFLLYSIKDFMIFKQTFHELNYSWFNFITLYERFHEFNFSNLQIFCVLGMHGDNVVYLEWRRRWRHKETCCQQGFLCWMHPIHVLRLPVAEQLEQGISLQTLCASLTIYHSCKKGK